MDAWGICSSPTCLLTISRKLCATATRAPSSTCRRRATRCKIHTLQDLDARLVQRVWREITLAAMDKPWLAQDAATAVDWKRRYKVLMRAGCRLKLPTVSIEELRREYTFHLDGPYVDGPYQPVIASLTGTARAANSDAEADEGHHESVTDAIFLDFKGDASGMVVPAYAQRHIRRDVQVHMLHVRRASDGRVAHLATFDLRERDEIYHENHSCTVFRSGQAGAEAQIARGNRFQAHITRPVSQRHRGLAWWRRRVTASKPEMATPA